MMLYVLFALIAWYVPAHAAAYLIDNNNIPYTITSPGRYLIIENISYAAPSAGSIITVASNDVILECAGYRIVQSGGVSNVNGIEVSPGYSHISIANGVIQDCSQTGVLVDGGCTQVDISNMACYDCGASAIACIGSSNMTLTGINIHDCTCVASATLASSDSVVTLSYVLASAVRNCSLYNNGSTVATGTLAMVRASNCQQLNLENLAITRGAGLYELRGISFDTTIHSIVSNCVVSNLIATGGGSSARGYILEGSSTSTGNIFTQCIARAITGTLKADGFLSSTGCDDNVFQCCISELHQATATTGASHGYRVVTNNRNTFKGCSALGCTAPNSTVGSPFYGAYGFKIDSATATCIHQCIANEQSAATRAVGIFVAASTNCSVTECTANHNTFGFDANSLVFNNNAFSKNFASKNTGATQYNGFGVNAANDSISAASIAINTTVALGPVSWSNVGIS